eukprot:2004112-Alexandrium_andersonii.AAC.1
MQAAGGSPTSSGGGQLPGPKRKDIVALRSSTYITLTRAIEKEMSTLKEAIESGVSLMRSSDAAKDK